MIEFFFVLICWAGFAILVAKAAESRGRDFGSWFVLAFFVSPLVAGFALLLYGTKEKPAPPSLEMQALKTHEAELELEIEKLKHAG